MRKKLSILLVVALLVAMLPATVFAASTNRTSNTLSVKKDFDFSSKMTTTTAGVISDNYADGEALLRDSSFPKLVIKATDPISAGSVITLALTNSEWSFNNLTAPAGSWWSTANSGATFTSDDSELIKKEDFSAATTPANFTIRKISSSRADVTINANLSKDDCIFIPLFAKVTATGAATVSIVSVGDAAVTTGEYTYANVGEGATKTTIASVKKFPDNVKLDTIVVDELQVGTVKTGTITLKLSANFKWTEPVPNPPTYMPVIGSGSLSGTSVGAISYAQYGSGVNISDDEETLEVPITTLTRTSTGSLVFNSFEVTATDDAAYGDVYVTISGAGITKETIKVAEYVDYGISYVAEEKDLPTLVSGIWPRSATSDSIKTLKTTFKEVTVDAWWANRKTTFTLPTGVKIRAVDIKTTNISTGAADGTVSLDYTTNTVTHTGVPAANYEVDKNKLTLRNIDVDATKKAEITFRFYVSIEAGFEGDITVACDAAEEDVVVTVAKAISPITVDVKSTDVNLGLKNIPVGEIVITESVAGAIRKSGTDAYDAGSEDLILSIEDMSFVKGVDLKNSKFEILEGDINLDRVEVTGGNVHIVVKSASSKPSKIRIYDNQVTLDRTLPEGDYELRAAGRSIIGNYTDESLLKKALFDTEYYVVAPNFARVITAAVNVGEKSIIKVGATVGSKTLVVGDKTIEMDVAPFIDANNRLMLPIRAVAVALGLTDSAVKWNDADKTVTVLANAIAQFKIGSRVLILNGVEVEMPTEPVIVDSRAFLPFRVLGEDIMGLSSDKVNWDATTMTATFN